MALLELPLAASGVGRDTRARLLGRYRLAAQPAGVKTPSAKQFELTEALEFVGRVPAALRYGLVVGLTGVRPSAHAALDFLPVG